MAGGKVCTSCGLTTDASGNLIADTNNSVWPLTACADTSGTPIYCGSDGALRGPAEKFSKFDRVGKNFITNTPVRMTLFVPQDGVLYDISSADRNTANSVDKTPLTFAIPNPSKCLPFNLHVEAGISHARVDYTGSPGNFQTELAAFVTMTGLMTNFSGFGGHQIWAFNTGTENVARSITFDTMGARATLVPSPGSLSATKFVIAPGGTATVIANPFMSLDVNGQSDVIDIRNYTIDVNWWGSND